MRIPSLIGDILGGAADAIYTLLSPDNAGEKSEICKEPSLKKNRLNQDFDRLKRTAQPSEPRRADSRRTEETLRVLSQSRHYRVLGLDANASAAQVKTAYRRLVKENHPDGNERALSDGGRKFREIQIAYEALQKAKAI